MKKPPGSSGILWGRTIEPSIWECALFFKKRGENNPEGCSEIHRGATTNMGPKGMSCGGRSSWISENGSTSSVSVGPAATPQNLRGRSIVSLTLLRMIIAVGCSYMLFPRLGRCSYSQLIFCVCVMSICSILCNAFAACIVIIVFFFYILLA